MAALSSAYRLAWWSCVLLAFVGPLSLVEKVHLSFCALRPCSSQSADPQCTRAGLQVGVAETWEAFGRYQRLVLRLGQDHPIRVPEQASATLWPLSCRRTWRRADAGQAPTRRRWLASASQRACSCRRAARSRYCGSTKTLSLGTGT